jgi:Rrf2 family protein
MASRILQSLTGRRRMSVMLSPQSKYALRAYIHLFRQPPGVFVKVESIAQEAELPAPYLSKILKALTEANLIISRRGKNGGVQRNQRCKSVSFLDICTAVGDPITRAECVLFKQACDKERPCQFHREWSQTKGRLLEYLRRTQVGTTEPRLLR